MIINYSLHNVTPYISWVYFFHAWQFPPRFAGIVQVHGCMGCRQSWVAQFPEEDRERANEAIKLFDDAVKMLNLLDLTYKTHAIFDLFPANGDDDNILVHREDDDDLQLPLLRQQHTTKPGEPYLCLSDFLRPKEMEADTLGVFATTVDKKMEQLYADDDYRQMLCKTLCDRLAEATAELMHEEVRKKYWGYAPDEDFTPQQLINEPYQGIRPAVGYPSLPDQSTNFLIDELLHLAQIGISLTENGAMSPHASVSGLMFAHPAARYFALGKIGEDQLRDYAQRRQLSVEKVKKFLAANV